MKKLITATLVGGAIIGSLLGAGAANALPTGDGTWLVPSEFSPGTYKATGSFGYVEVCADLDCEIDFDGSDATGLIDNYVVSGPTYIVVPSNAVAVTTQSVTLTKVS